MKGYLPDLVQHRHLILSFAWRDIRARYKQTAFGAAWAIIQPLSLTLMFTLVFSHFAKIPSDGIPYAVFSYSGLIFWTFFATSVSQGTLAVVANASLVRKVYFPRETLLLSVLLSTGLDLAVAMMIFVGMLIYFGIAVTWTVVWVIPLLVLQVLFVLGVICLTSICHVRYRDIGHGLPLLMQLWMLATPVAYPLSLVPQWILPWYLLNPMASIIDGYRRAMLLNEAPNLRDVGVGLWVALVLLGVAYLGFKRAERTFADVV